MYSSVELFARLLQLSPDKLPRTDGMLSFRINSLQEGVSANGGFRLDVATTPTNPERAGGQLRGYSSRPYRTVKFGHDSNVGKNGPRHPAKVGESLIVAFQESLRVLGRKCHHEAQSSECGRSMHWKCALPSHLKRERMEHDCPTRQDAAAVAQLLAAKAGTRSEQLSRVTRTLD
jgi:hypothetical protein